MEGVYSSTWHRGSVLSPRGCTLQGQLSQDVLGGTRTPVYVGTRVRSCNKTRLLHDRCALLHLLAQGGMGLIARGRTGFLPGQASLASFPQTRALDLLA